MYLASENFLQFGSLGVFSCVTFVLLFLCIPGNIILNNLLCFIGALFLSQIASKAAKGFDKRIKKQDKANRFTKKHTEKLVEAICDRFVSPIVKYFFCSAKLSKLLEEDLNVLLQKILTFLFYLRPSAITACFYDLVLFSSQINEQNDDGAKGRSQKKIIGVSCLFLFELFLKIRELSGKKIKINYLVSNGFIKYVMSC